VVRDRKTRGKNSRDGERRLLNQKKNPLCTTPLLERTTTEYKGKFKKNTTSELLTFTRTTKKGLVKKKRRLRREKLVADSSRWNSTHH